MTDKTSERRARDALDDIDGAIATITDADIEERLRDILRRAQFGRPDPAPTAARTALPNGEPTPVGEPGETAH